MSKVNIHLDFETASRVDLKKVGSSRYSRDPSTRVLLVGYAINGEKVKCHLPRKVEVMQELIDTVLFTHPDELTITAHNYSFEKDIWNNVCVPKYNFPEVPNTCWDCTAARSRALGLPGSLEGASKAVGLEHSKLKEGARLISKYSKPDRVTNRMRKLTSNPSDFRQFRAYCIQDVEIERQLDALLPPLHPFEKKVFDLDGKINERGIPINMEFLDAAEDIVAGLEKNYAERALELTGYKATQNARILEWLKEHGLDVDNLQAKTVEDSLKRDDLSDLVKEVLSIRFEASRAGPKKLKKIRMMVPDDARIRGGFIYHGATTGRWTAVGLQPQNFGKTKFEHQMAVYAALLDAHNGANHYDNMASAFSRKFDRPMDELSHCLRAVVAVPEHRKLIAADYSSIEARVLAWLAGEEWLVDAFHQNIDAYKQMASMIFRKPIEDIDDDERFVGKQLVLGCGYSMSGARFQERCRDFGREFTLQEANAYVREYRKSVPEIVKLWDKLIKAAIMSLRPEAKGRGVRVGKVVFRKEWIAESWFLTIELPTGRKLHYQNPRIRGRNVSFDKYLGGTKVSGSLYGGFVAQNVTQAVSRDLLCHGLFNLDAAGYDIIMHVHDDICSEVDVEFGSVEEYEDLMCRMPPWAGGLPVKAEGWESQYWRK